jgi:DMSO/TMAO reductase YedYZ heme-binding membrane subunit
LPAPGTDVSALLATGGAGNAKALWYLTRGTGTVALLLLTAGLVLGVAGSTRWRSGRVPRFVVAALHRNVTLLALAFVVVHVVTTVADGFAPIGYRDAVVPFVSPYRPIWLGLGAVGLDLLLALVATSLFRTRLGVRSWRAVHWLAYASWPVALVHALGTGSDVHAGWLPLLGLGCAGAVALAVGWRIVAADGRGQVRIGAALTALAVGVGVFVWARSGPLGHGWAARAGTPRALLAPAQAPAVRRLAAAARPPATLPSGSFAASFQGRVREQPTAGGLVVVAIDGIARGGFSGRVHVALRGMPLEGGGVQMVDSTVGLLPNGAAAWYAGRVVALDGSRIVADVGGGASRKVRVLLALRLQPGSSAVTGSIRGGAKTGRAE